MTIPAWLNTVAEEAHLNFSQILQNGIKKGLNIQLAKRSGITGALAVCSLFWSMDGLFGMSITPSERFLYFTDLLVLLSKNTEFS